MIEINLLPKEQQKRKIELPGISFLPIFAAVLGVIVVAHLLFSLSLNLKARALRRLERRWQEIAPEKEKADKVILELTTMRARINAIDELVQGRMDWAKKLSDLSGAMIPGVWLKKLWVETKTIPLERKTKKKQVGATQVKTELETVMSKTLHLNGSVIVTGGEETAAVGKFMWTLKNDEAFFADFRDIESAYMKQSKEKDIEVMDFELVCYFKQEEN